MEYQSVFKKRKRIGDSNKDKKIIQLGYRNEIWHRKMCHAYHEKQKKTNNRRNRTAKSRNRQNARSKGKLQALGNIGSGSYQTIEEERKKKGKKKMKWVPQTNEKAYLTEINSKE